ncbi:SseB family protein [Georgenia sp. MJ173]|uniref:SseB family protein n=1 Tax=Georgenia sunbinii TaxID=3117728 RepID=UPI002F262C05
MTPLPPEMMPGAQGGPAVDPSLAAKLGGRQPGGAADSAGQPWSGRTLKPNPFSGDDGSAPAAIVAALALDDETERLVALADALRDARVIVPVVAHEHPGRGEDGEVVSHTKHGSGDPQADACASAAMVSVRTPDGRAALPVFSSVEAMQAWDATARPVPVEGVRAALAAVADADSMLVLDAAGPVTALLGRPAVWSIVHNEPWVPSWQDPELPAVAANALRGITELTAVRLERGSSSELRAVLAVAHDLTRDQVMDVITRAQQALSSDPTLTDRVDSLELYPMAVQ